jgi:hypothetical protein
LLLFFGCLLFFSTPIITDLTGNDVSNSTAGVESPTYQRLTFNIPLCLLNKNVDIKISANDPFLK